MLHMMKLRILAVPWGVRCFGSRDVNFGLKGMLRIQKDDEFGGGRSTLPLMGLLNESNQGLASQTLFMAGHQFRVRGGYVNHKDLKPDEKLLKNLLSKVRVTPVKNSTSFYKIREPGEEDDEEVEEEYKMFEKKEFEPEYYFREVEVRKPPPPKEKRKTYDWPTELYRKTKMYEEESTPAVIPVRRMGNTSGEESRGVFSQSRCSLLGREMPPELKHGLETSGRAGCVFRMSPSSFTPFM